MDRLVITLIEEGYSLEEARKIALIAEKNHIERNKLTSRAIRIFFGFRQP